MTVVHRLWAALVVERLAASRLKTGVGIGWLGVGTISPQVSASLGIGPCASSDEGNGSAYGLRHSQREVV